MVKAKIRFQLHRTVIVMICLALLVLVMQGASYFSMNHQLARSEQVEEIAQTLASQVAERIKPILNQRDPDRKKISQILTGLTEHSRILDASVYRIDGSLVASAGETVSVRDRLALDKKRTGSYFTRQIVQLFENQGQPQGFIRLTLDTHVLETEAQHVDNTTNLLRLMMLLSLAIGIILAKTLLQSRRTRWQQSPYLLTANKQVDEPTDTD